MRLIIQRVEHASLTVDEAERGCFDKGLVVYVGFKDGDETLTEDILDKVARKLVSLRIFEDGSGKLNLSAKDIGGGIMLISNFTLYGEISSGNRPSFSNALAYEHAKRLFESLVSVVREECRKHDLPFIPGDFGAYMIIDSKAYGPVNIVWEV